MGFPLFIRVLPGIMVMTGIAVLARGTQDIGFPQWQGLEVFLASSPLMQKIFIGGVHLNYILIAIILGMIFKNFLGIPEWAQPGVTTSRLFIKLGVILLGSLYSIADLANLGSTAIIMILVFLFSTLIFSMWLGKKIGLNPTSASVLAAGTSVCGVSAIIATAPVVRAKVSDVIYSIATILSWGIIFLFIFPTVGNLVGLSAHQFGVWAGTGILNSGQVLAASLAFDPGTADNFSESLKTGEIYNLTRVIFLPFVVLGLAIYSGQTQEDEYNINTGLWDKFPVFVLGFLVMVFLTSFGLFGDTSPPSPELKFIRNLYSWFFTIGLAGLGMQISFAEMRKAGGKPLIVGSVAAVLKALLALIAVLLFIPAHP